MTSPDIKAPGDHPTLTTHPLLGVAGVLLGAMIATCTGRLMNMLGLNGQLGDVLTNHRLLGLGHAFASRSTGPAAVGRAAEVLGLQVRRKPSPWPSQTVFIS